MSHRAAMPPSLGGDISQRPPGSIQSVAAIMQRGICAFDVDVFRTADDVLVVGHPSEVRERLSLSTPPTALTLSELHTLDGGSTATVLELLQAIRQLAPAAGPCSRTPELTGDKGNGASSGDASSAEGEVALAAAAAAGQETAKTKRASSAKKTPLRLLLEPKGDAASVETVRAIARALPQGLLAPAGDVWAAVGPAADFPELLSFADSVRGRGQIVLAWGVDTSRGGPRRRTERFRRGHHQQRALSHGRAPGLRLPWLGSLRQDWAACGGPIFHHHYQR
ncbi:unnamed protein product [Prorocentrum cordatum]|uniref:Glycerophosphodiester phosphodiesterase n=1 Tax=Prorocentrum cordatum TaxID=2364126 RepID=A0ABN9V5U7_9DINO|nr:unnamed protein product [Polarella glacialis]